MGKKSEISKNTAVSLHKRNVNIFARLAFLFDADKLDVVGATGIARTLLYKGIVSEPLYSLLPDGEVSAGESDEAPSFFKEYKHKLEHLYSNFYTVKAAEMAKERQQIAVDFYNCLYREVSMAYENGMSELSKLIRKNGCT